MREPPPMCYVENVSSGLSYIMPGTLVTIWAIQVNFFFFFSHQRTKASTFLCPMFGASQQSLTQLFCGVEGGKDFEDI